jgi:signal transduction histidine kinase
MNLPNIKKPETVLILAPTYQDAQVASAVLTGAGVLARPCTSVTELCEQLQFHYGAVVIAEEAIGVSDIHQLQKALEDQPPWSDIPIILLTSSDIVRGMELFTSSGNISILERPFAKLTFIRSVEVALRARQKQYEVRDLLLALHQAKEQAERANVSKTQFLANMSHEIRTPIGAILGFTDLLKNSANTPEENLEYMGIVERNSFQLLKLIDDILDLSKVESGSMTIERIEFSLTEMLADFVSIMKFKAHEKGIEFRFAFTTLVPEHICLDPVRLRQILTNIAGNAIKFTDQGYVELSVGYVQPHLIFSIKDTGIGIAKTQEARLLRPFSHADTSTPRMFGGTGLGLALSRRLAEALGGKVELLRTVEGKGSTFVIEIEAPLLPNVRMVGKDTLQVTRSELSGTGPQRVLQGLRVLLTEDSPDNQKLIATYLQKEGANVQFANNGAEGVELALAQDFDVVVMDIQMPVLDGHGAAQQLRQVKYSKPLVALTAHAMKEERVRCFESGFTEFLTKPVDRSSLIEALARYVEK